MKTIESRKTKGGCCDNCGDVFHDDAAQILCPACRPWAKSELTPTGEQYVIPGAERDPERGPDQLGLW